MIPSLFNAAALVLASAYVTTLVVDRARGGFVVASVACAALSFASELRSWRVLRHAWETGIPAVVAAAAAASAAGVLAEFAVSYATASLILLWILVAHREGRVLYEPDRASFVFTRCGLYGALRAALVLAQRHWAWLTPARAHLALLTIPTVETLLMWTSGSRWYRHEVSRTSRATYALLKTAVFLAVPWLDEILYALVHATP